MGSEMLATVRVLVVDDFEPFRRFVESMAGTQRTWQIVCEVSDGLEAVQKAEELQPDLILLDIGLSRLNGIEAARCIHKVSSKSKILFLSQQTSADVVQAALSTGARGYVLKSDAGRELLPAVQAILKGGMFVSSSLAGQVNSTREQLIDQPSRNGVVAPFPTQEVSRRHEVAFYADDASLVDGFSRFIENALRIGSAVIVIARESHRDSLLQKLGDGLDVGRLIELGSYIPVDAADLLATFLVDDLPDPVRVMKVAGDLITRAKLAKGEHRRVAACGECAPALLAEGKAEAAIQLEHIWDGIGRSYDTDTLCGYLSNDFRGAEDSRIFEKVCAAHSAVHAE